MPHATARAHPSGPLSRNQYETSQSGLLASFGGAGLSAIQRSFQPPLLVAQSTSVNLVLPLLADEGSISPSTEVRRAHRSRRPEEEGPRRVLEARENTTRSTPGNRAYGTLRQRCNKHDPWFMGTTPPVMKDSSLAGFQSLYLCTSHWI